MTLKLEAGVAWAAVTITLNSMTDGSINVSTTVIDNDTDLNLWLDASLILGSFTPGAAPSVELHVVPLLRNGTTYADAVISGATLAMAKPVSSGASAKNLFFGRDGRSDGILLPPGKCKLAVGNRTGQTWAGSGNELYYRTYRLG